MRYAIVAIFGLPMVNNGPALSVRQTRSMPSCDNDCNAAAADAVGIFLRRLISLWSAIVKRSSTTVSTAKPCANVGKSGALICMSSNAYTETWTGTVSSASVDLADMVRCAALFEKMRGIIGESRLCRGDMTDM